MLISSPRLLFNARTLCTSPVNQHSSREPVDKVLISNLTSSLLNLASALMVYSFVRTRPSTKWIRFCYRCVARAGRKRVPLTTKRRLSPSVPDDDRPALVKRKIIGRLDCAGAPITANPETAPKDDVVETTLILVPVSKTTSPAPPIEAKIDAPKVDGRATVKVLDTPSVRYRAIAPKAVSKKATTKIIVPWVQAVSPMVVANCATPTTKVAVRGATRLQTAAASLAPYLGSQPAVATTNSQASTRLERSSAPTAADEELHSCHHCRYSSRRKGDIRRHIVNVHLTRRKSHVQTDVQKLECNLCGRLYSYKSALRRHMLRKHIADDTSSAAACPKDRKQYGFCCDVCGRGCQKQREMMAHREAYHATAPPVRWSAFQASEGRLKQCANCGRLFRGGRFFEEHSCLDEEEEATLEERVQQLLRAQPSFRCDVCALSFRWKPIFRQHREITHSDAAPLDWETVKAAEVRHYCATCFKAFDTEALVEQHECVKVELEAKPKVWVCPLCGLKYRRKSDFRRHRRLSHAVADEDPYAEAERQKPAIECPYCDHVTLKRSHMLWHIKAEHGMELSSPFVCVVCNKVFKLKMTLDTHNQTYHPKDESAADNERILRETQILVNGEPAYRCSLCNRNWSNSVRFLAHHRLHQVECKFTCDSCGKQTRTQYQLTQHIKTTHLDIRNYACDFCPKSFHTKQSLDQHRRIHTGERPYSCEICGKTFVSMNALISHKRIHNDFFPHACHLCPKKFKVRRSLIHHIRRHTGERPYQCEICSKTFNNSSLFSYHQKVTHSDNRPFKCEQCGSRFKANRFLTRHLKLHETRTHIQFKRRNNPEYFAAQKTASRNGNSGAAAPEELNSKEDVVISSEVDVEIVEPGSSVDTVVSPVAP